jgi:hypothetical protein
LTTAVTDVEHIHGSVLNREENPIYVRLLAIEQMANLKREGYIFRGEWATLGEFS